jgi:hypothetical protein
MRSPIATPEEVAAEPAPFPSKTAAAPIEAFFSDWRRRLTRNLSRRSTSRWEPLTWVHANGSPTSTEIAMSLRPLDEYRDTPLWAAVEATIAELVATRELAMNTAPEYVTEFLCQELAAKKLIVLAGLRKCCSR